MNDASGSDATTSASARHGNAALRVLGVAVTALALVIGAAVPASAAELMRVTFVRHGQSAGNASGLIDTSTPGPVLTPLGQQQAQTVAGTLGDNNYDAIYASTMVRTQLTAAPMSQYLRLPIQVLAGLQEIEAGVFEGTPESQAADGYGLFPLAWAIQGNRDLRIPGSIDGNEFDARVDGALETIYDGGDRNAVIFSHGGAIMFWTMMNAQNLTAAEKINLLRTAPLSNTNYVIIEGNAEDGWTLVNWNGRLFSPEPTLGAEIRRQWRTLNRQIAASNKVFLASFGSRDFATIATAFTRSVADNVFSITKYHRAIQAKVIHDLGTLFARPADDAPSTVTNLAAGDTVETTPAPAPARTASAAGDGPARKSVAVVTDETTAAERDAAADGVNADGEGDLTDGDLTAEADSTEDVTNEDTAVEDIAAAEDTAVTEDSDAVSDNLSAEGEDEDENATSTTSDESGAAGDNGGDAERDAA